MRTLNRHWRGREDGVTLTELLITIAILTIIIGPLAAAMIVFIRNTDATADRMAESHDAQIAAAYFTQDVQSIGLRDWTTAPYTTYLPSVHKSVADAIGVDDCIPAGATALVRLSWDEPAPSVTAGVRRVSYVVQGTELHRVACHPAGGETDTVIVHNLSTVPAEAPTVACTGASGTAMPTCTSGTEVLPAKVSLTITLRASAAGTPYTVTLVGERRQT